MASASTPPRYDSMAIIHFTLRPEAQLRANSQHLASVWENYYFRGQVHHADEVRMGLTSCKGKDAMCDRAVEYFEEWIEENKPAPGERKLFAVGFLGHANLNPYLTWPKFWQHFHLRALGKPYAIDLTRLQQLARDKYDYDFLFYFECCESGGRPNVGMDAPSAALLASPKRQIIETLGAGVRVLINNSDKDWSRRFAKNLVDDRGPKSVKQRHDAIKTNESLWDVVNPARAPGTYKLEYPPDGSASIVLQPVVGM